MSTLRRIRLSLDHGVRFTTLIPRAAPIDQRDLEWIRDLSARSQVSELQKQVLLSLRHGQTWTASMVQETFGPFKRLEAESILHGLATLKLAVGTDSEQGSAYSIVPQLAAPHSTSAPEEIVIESPRAKPPKAAKALLLSEPTGQELQQLPTPLPQSKNAQLVWAALGSGPQNVLGLEQLTGLSANRIRYAIRPLIASGSVVRDGGQGHRGTTYSRNP